ncbi:hypothetical protein [Piscinibacter terrae]|uniref:Secreted protein n=1 Tax=Piscinibacter terrae TaxID=2496871 RepID=A0A3N7HJA6_9BURK|nr:hypothetical protein [Albitalea terrae]RQP22140.1 hypothetical protein DZC73_24365 [Albitalea terrae]
MNKPFLLLLGAIAIASGWALVSGDSLASASRDATTSSPIVLGIASSHAQPADAKLERFDETPAEPPKREDNGER